MEKAEKPAGRVPGSQLLPSWVDGSDGRRGNIIAAASMGSKKTTAQVREQSERDVAADLL